MSTQELHRYLCSLGKKRHQWNINLLILALNTVMMLKWWHKVAHPKLYIRRKIKCYGVSQFKFHFRKYTLITLQSLTHLPNRLTQP